MDVGRLDLATLLDQQALFRLVLLERFYRDRGRWEEMAACFTEHSYVRTTWFEGSGRAFAEESAEMARRGRHSTHVVWPIYAEVRGDRALVESRAEIQNRAEIDSVEVDMVQYCRFFSRAVRTPDGWRLASFEGIYQRDTITPLDPADKLPLDFAELHGLRPAYRIWAWTIARRGYDVSQDLFGDDRPDLLEPFYAAARRWLNTGRDGPIG